MTIRAIDLHAIAALVPAVAELPLADFRRSGTLQGDLHHRVPVETSVPVRAQSRQAAVPVRDRRGGRDLHPRILQGQTPRSAESIAQAGRQGRQAGSVGGADPSHRRPRPHRRDHRCRPGLDAASITAALGQVITRPAELCCNGGAAITAFARRARVKFHVLPAPGTPKPEAPDLHINNVNAYHGRLKEWMRRFHGVATPTDRRGHDPRASFSLSTRFSRVTRRLSEMSNCY